MWHKAFESDEVNNIIQALGIRFGMGEDSKEANLDKLRYHKVIIMADADVDGQHIATLIMTLFYRYMPQIIQDGYLYIAMPPSISVRRARCQNIVTTTAIVKSLWISMATVPKAVSLPSVTKVWVR